MPSTAKSPLVIAGMMTGTSCDGLDAVTVEFDRDGFRVLDHASRPFPPALRRQVLAFQRPGAAHDSKTWLRLNRELGEWHAASALSLLRRRRRTVDVIANHGQTLAHFPGIGTLQLGDPAWIAAKTGLTVVSQFRTGDMAAGGQGAPLVPGFHRLLARSTGASRNGCSIHNIGGISNLTYLHGEAPPRAWDTGPGNLWIDLAVARASRGKLLMDEGGRLARLGTPDESAIALLLRHPYFRRKPPKSTGRDEFTEVALARALRRLPLADAAATATLATARSMVNDYRRNILERGLALETIYLCGGGAKNATLVECLQVEFLRQGWLVRIRGSEALGVAPQQMEAAAFAFLARESLLGRAIGGAWTGARRFGPPGQITPGENWASVARKIPGLL